MSSSPQENHPKKPPGQKDTYPAASTAAKLKLAHGVIGLLAEILKLINNLFQV